MFPVAPWAGRPLAALLLSTVFVWGPPVAAPAATTPVQATAARFLTLDPSQGPPGSRVGVRGYGFEDCKRTSTGLTAEPPPAAEPGEIHVVFEGSDNPSVVTADADGTFETDVTVPSDAAPGSHDVTALCTDNSKLRATADFQVTPDEPGTPALTLDPAEGPVETSVTVAGSGFESCTAQGRRAGTVALAWDGSALAAVTPTEITVEEGGFTAAFVVPSDAEASDATDHAVTATCVGYEQVSAEQRFTVTTTVPGSEPEVSLDPASMEPGGGSVAMSGSGFDCPEVALLWEGEEWGTVATVEGGTFDARFDVSPDAAEASYTVRAECTDDRGVGAEAVFTVTGLAPVPTPTTPTPNPTPTTPDPNPVPSPDTDPDANPESVDVPVGLVVGAGLLGAALLALAGSAFLGHRRRGPRWVHDHLSSRPRPAPAATDVTEPSETGGPPTRSIRLEPHPDPGDQTLQEDDP
ncbi:hypothetical protein [Streptomyces sp. RerS4]|uniref:hypothetical protein n=1 Tax=Streptomyces sp. RerS4 TaxID=2942449 RepID=UPI00201BDD9D|nr:hypothetical protein [Streptomyces sp. RerS4]UQX04522.1 hypothetical protein M4D82_31430 [Streptomyces sp. RerS4]